MALLAVRNPLISPIKSLDSSEAMRLGAAEMTRRARLMHAPRAHLEVQPMAVAPERPEEALQTAP